MIFQLWTIICLWQERETELAKIRSRFQKADNMWKNKDEAADAKKNTDAKVRDMSMLLPLTC